MPLDAIRTWYPPESHRGNVSDQIHFLDRSVNNADDVIGWFGYDGSYWTAAYPGFGIYGVATMVFPPGTFIMAGGQFSRPMRDQRNWTGWVCLITPKTDGVSTSKYIQFVRPFEGVKAICDFRCEFGNGGGSVFDPYQRIWNGYSVSDSAIYVRTTRSDGNVFYTQWYQVNQNGDETILPLDFVPSPVDVLNEFLDDLSLHGDAMPLYPINPNPPGHQCYRVSATTTMLNYTMPTNALSITSQFGSFDGLLIPCNTAFYNGIKWSTPNLASFFIMRNGLPPYINGPEIPSMPGYYATQVPAPLPPQETIAKIQGPYISQTARCYASDAAPRDYIDRYRIYSAVWGQSNGYASVSRYQDYLQTGPVPAFGRRRGRRNRGTMPFFPAEIADYL